MVDYTYGGKIGIIHGLQNRNYFEIALLYGLVGVLTVNALLSLQITI